MKVVLIGPRGAGKSTVAQALRFALGFPVTAIDALIEQQAGCSIAELVEREGWDGFRQREADAIQRIEDPDETILDVGGGAVMNPDNVTALTAGETCVIYLTASAATLKARIAGDGRRPPLTDAPDPAKEIDAILAERGPVYEGLADHTFSTDDQSAEEIAEAIRDIVERA